MTVWFSGSAVVTSLTALWSLGDSGRAWLTMSVQVGFVAGALVSAALSLADRVPARRLFSVAALLAAAATASIPAFARGLGTALVLRFLTGFFLAGVYPVGMKIMATWTRRNRGLAIGLLVGALTLGNAAPHLIRAFGGAGQWQLVLYVSGSLAALGALVSLLFVREGPYRAPSPPISIAHVGAILSDRPVLLANLGYLSHMWELFAMWSWVPIFLLASFEVSGTAPIWAGLAAFAVIGAGAPGSLLAGWLADRLGRTRLISVSLLVSGGCAMAAGHLYGSSPLLQFPILLLWGFAVVADSAQYSAYVSELCNPRHTGTALTLQTSLGFLLTLVTIRVVPTLVAQVGWGWAFSLLAVGPLVGLWAMRLLGRMPAAARLSGGRG
jgi:MFS family permease